MTDGLDEGPTEEDRRLAADHDDEGVDVAWLLLEPLVVNRQEPRVMTMMARFCCRHLDVPLRGNVVVAPVPHHGPVLRLMVAIRWPLATLSPI